MSRATWRILLIRLFILSLHNLKRTFGQGVDECLAILFRKDAIVQSHNDSRIRLGADQTPHSLAKFQYGFGQGEFPERIPAALFYSFDSRFDQGMIRHCERQPCDDDVRKRLPRDIDSLPKTVGPKQDRI